MKRLLAITFTAALAAVSHILAAALNTWLVSSVNLSASTFGRELDCYVSNGAFQAEVVTGSGSAACPVTSGGGATKKYVCDQSPLPDGVKPDDCGLLKAFQAMIVLACMSSLGAFLALIYQIFRAKQELAFSRTQTGVIALTVFAGITEFIAVIIFEARSNDDDDGWSDSYGCEDGTIYNFSGRTCLYRGSAYVFAWLGVIFSLGVGVAHCFIMRNDYLNKGEERYDGSLDYQALRDPV
mmetsp:Transcript_10408/g.21000  ORF Transcript_10408/g.21000 Transcript_10408/m.21000 type:complete len:239 (+) Transcript_10408:133-849(+)